MMPRLNRSASELVTKYSRNLVLLMHMGQDRNSSSASEKTWAQFLQTSTITALAAGKGSSGIKDVH